MCIGYSASEGCSSLPVENDIRYADTYLVKAVNINHTTYQIKEGTRFIGDFAFSLCSRLTSITIPDSVTSIGDHTFWGCKGLTSINIPDSVKNIGYCAFQGCTGLTSINIPNSVTSIGAWAFRGCSSLSNISVSPQNTYFDSRDNCNAVIETATNTLVIGCQCTIIPYSVTSIGAWAFEGCSGLTSITIPDSVAYIGYHTFESCTNMKEIHIHSLRPSLIHIYDSFTENIFNSCILFVPKAAEDAYRSHLIFNKFKTIQPESAPVEDGTNVK